MPFYRSKLLTKNFINPLLISSGAFITYKLSASLVNLENNKETNSIKQQLDKNCSNLGVIFFGKKDFGLNQIDFPKESKNSISEFEKFVFKDLKILNDDTLALVDVNGDARIFLPGKNTFNLSGFRIKEICLSKEKLTFLDDCGVIYAINYTSLSKDIECRTKGWLSYFKKPSLLEKELISASLNKEKIVKIDNGKHHIVALSNKGNVYTFPTDENANRYGQMGLGTSVIKNIRSTDNTTEMKYELNKVDVRKQIVEIACGNDHTLLRAENGDVYGFGLNSFGQLTNYKKSHFSPDTFIVPSPVKLITENTINYNLTEEPKITNIFAGGDLSMFVLRKNAANIHTEYEYETYACGNGRYGQLGGNQYIHVQPNLVKIPFLSNRFEFNEKENKLKGVGLTDAFIGASHLAAILDNSAGDNLGKSIVMWGNNLHGQCNAPKRGNIAVPTYPFSLAIASNPKAKETNKFPFGLFGSETFQLNDRMQLCDTVSVKSRTFSGKEKWVRAQQKLAMGSNSTAVYFKMADPK